MVPYMTDKKAVKDRAKQNSFVSSWTVLDCYFLTQSLVLDSSLKEIGAHDQDR